MGAIIVAVLTLIILPLIVTAVWELWLRDIFLPLSLRLRYYLRRQLAKEPSLSKILGAVGEFCGPNNTTQNVMHNLDMESLAVDGCFEILHSHAYRGWVREDIEFEPLAGAVHLPADLQRLADENKPLPPNHGKYRLYRMVPDSSERPRLRIQLSPTNYFHTFPIQRRLFEPILPADGPYKISPFDKYHQELLDFGEHPIPNIVCLHVVVVLQGNKLLLTQRMKSSKEVDWEFGKWACSFEEQMTVKTESPEPRVDQDFFGTLFAGLHEEVGVEKRNVEDARILSLVLETDGIVVDPIAYVRVQQTFDDVEAHWLLKARDGARRELRKVDFIDFTLAATIPILRGRELQAAKNRIPPTEWHVTSRMRLLAALFHAYGIEQTLSKLAGSQGAHAVES